MTKPAMWRPSRCVIALATLEALSGCAASAGQRETAEASPPSVAEDRPGSARAVVNQRMASDVADAVRDRIALEGIAHRSGRLDVTAQDGVVTLDGWVDTLWIKRDAERVAAKVRGVRAVINQLIVVSPAESDHSVRMNVLRALKGDSATADVALNAIVHRGKVFLTGWTDSWQEKQAAVEVASRVVGVLDIDDKLTVAYRPYRADEDIRQDVLRRLENDARLDPTHVRVEVTNGSVKLRGRVGSLGEVSRAQLDARVEGVRDIVALLEVDETLIDSRQARFTETRGDQALQAALRDTFRYDSRLKGAALRARVESGLVTLEGTVSSAAAHRAAVDDALNVAGVRQVVDQITVLPAARFGDRAIEARIRRALRENPRLRSAISVSVYDGTAVVHGMVASANERAEVERTVGSVAGVAVIDDATRVQGPSSPLMSDTELASRARRLLHWNAEVGPNNVRIDVSDGVMTLTGTVDSWRQFNAIMEDIYGLGPTKVVQRIDVRSAGKTQPARFLETWDMQPASGRAEPRSR